MSGIVGRDNSRKFLSQPFNVGTFRALPPNPLRPRCEIFFSEPLFAPRFCSMTPFNHRSASTPRTTMGFRVVPSDGFYRFARYAMYQKRQRFFTVIRWTVSACVWSSYSFVSLIDVFLSYYASRSVWRDRNLGRKENKSSIFDIDRRSPLVSRPNTPTKIVQKLFADQTPSRLKGRRDATRQTCDSLRA